MARRILKNDDLRDISAMYHKGYTQQEIAEKYGVSQSTVSNAMHHMRNMELVSEIRRLREDLRQGGGYMSFEYKGKLGSLAGFYASMKQQNIQIGTFDHNYNHVDSCVIFDTSEDEWRLVFFKRAVGDTLIVPIEVGYKFSIVGDEKYKEFVDYFGIGHGRGEFHIAEFKENLNGQIPETYQLNDYARKQVIRYNRIDPDSEGIYPIGTINWQLQHALHPEWPDDKYHRSAENLKKTRQLYPAIYAATRNMDVTIRYGVDPGKNTDNMVNGNYAWQDDNDINGICDFIWRVCVDINNEVYNPDEIRRADTINRALRENGNPVYRRRFNKMDQMNLGSTLATGLSKIQKR